MGIKKKHLYLILLLVAAVLVTVYTLSHMVTSPGHSLVTLGGDGLKNYYSYLYHIMNGTGVQFEGMNYPFGEHIVYSDGQPLLSIALSSITKVVPLTYSNLLAVLHLALAFSFFFAIVFTYKIIVHFKVHPIYAIVVSVLIVLMSPQLFRIHGHFGLGYQSIIPMLFYWNVKYDSTKKTGYVVFILVLGIASALLHPYCAALFFIWIMLYVIGYLIITKRSIKERLKHVAPIAASGVAILGFVKLFMSLTDIVTDRTEYPYGTLSAITTWADIFTSENSPISQGLQIVGLVEKTGKGEGLAYLGVVGISVLLIVIVTIVISRFKKKKLFSTSQNVAFSPVWLFIALGAILLAQGVPFVWHMEWLFDYISSFRQFRSLGRFATLFYYIASVYTVIILYNGFLALVEKGKRGLGYCLLLFPLMLWGLEANGYLIASRKATNNALNNYSYVFGHNSWQKVLTKQWFKSEDFQGIIILPYIHVGSEKIWLNGDNFWAFTLGARCALQLKLPIVNVSMSRTSWAQTFAQVKTIGGPLVHKPLLVSIKSDKPFLLLHWQEKELDLDSRYLIDVGEYIDRLDQVDAYALYPQKLELKDDNYKDSIKELVGNLNTTDSCFGCNELPYVIDHFDEDETADCIYGKGAKSADKQSTADVKTYYFDQINDTTLYELSFWSLVNNHDYRTPTFVVETLDTLGNITSACNVKASESVDNYGEGSWLRANKYFEVPKRTSALKISIPKDFLSNFIAFDEIVFRPANSITISQYKNDTTHSVMVNNHVFLNCK